MFRGVLTAALYGSLAGGRGDVPVFWMMQEFNSTRLDSTYPLNAIPSSPPFFQSSHFSLSPKAGNVLPNFVHARLAPSVTCSPKIIFAYQAPFLGGVIPRLDIRLINHKTGSNSQSHHRYLPPFFNLRTSPLSPNAACSTRPSSYMAPFTCSPNIIFVFPSSFLSGIRPRQAPVKR